MTLIGNSEEEGRKMAKDSYYDEMWENSSEDEILI